MSLGGRLGGVARPFLSEDSARTDDLLCSPEVLLVEVDFRGCATLGDACELLLLPDGCGWPLRLGVGCDCSEPSFSKALK